MGPFLVEIVFCPVTRRGRKKKKGQNKNAITSGKNEGPLYRFVPAEDTVKVTFDLSEDGPVFSALDQMMMKLIDADAEERKNEKSKSEEAKKALKNLLRSGIPGIESMFAGPGQSKASKSKRSAGKLSGRQKGFHKMTDQSRGKFMKAIFGKDGQTIDTATAAALLAATYSGGDPQLGENIAQLLVPEMGETVDQNMMAALMSSSSMINAGATTEEVMRCMKDELSKSGLGEEEILAKTKAVMKAFGKEDAGSNLLDLNLVSKQTNSALKQAGVSPKDFAKIVLCQRIISSVGLRPENLAKLMIVQSQLTRRGAKAEHVAEVFRNIVGDPANTKCKSAEDLHSVLGEERLRKDDVTTCVRVAEALENENEPTWKEVKQMKDILGGASTSSAESIGLNLQRAVKAAGLTKSDLANAMLAQRAIASIDPDPQFTAKLLLTQRAIAGSGVPPVEIARVLGDGNPSSELFHSLADAALAASADQKFSASDVDVMVRLYDQMTIKANVPQEVIEHIDRNLIQVRCSLEDVASNHINSLLTRGERESVIARSLCDVLRKTNASLEIVMSTMFGALKDSFGERMTDLEVIKMLGRANVEAAINFEADEFLLALKAMQQDHPDINEDLMKTAMEQLLKELQWFPDDIRTKMDEIYPPPPPPEKKEEEPDEIDTLTADEIFAKFMKSKGGDSEHSSRRSSIDGPGATKKMKTEDGMQDEGLAKALLKRKGSTTSVVGASSPTMSRRGSFLTPETTKRSSVAIVVDRKKKKKKTVRKDRGGAAAESLEEDLNEDDSLEESSSSDEEQEGLQPLDATAIAQLKKMLPPNAEVQQSLEEGCFVDASGVLRSVEGEALAGPDGRPIMLIDPKEALAMSLKKKRQQLREARGPGDHEDADSSIDDDDPEFMAELEKMMSSADNDQGFDARALMEGLEELGGFASEGGANEMPKFVFKLAKPGAGQQPKEESSEKRKKVGKIGTKLDRKQQQGGEKTKSRKKASRKIDPSLVKEKKEDEERKLFKGPTRKKSRAKAGSTKSADATDDAAAGERDHDDEEDSIDSSSDHFYENESDDEPEDVEQMESSPDKTVIDASQGGTISPDLAEAIDFTGGLGDMDYSSSNLDYLDDLLQLSSGEKSSSKKKKEAKPKLVMKLSVGKQQQQQPQEVQQPERKRTVGKVAPRKVKQESSVKPTVRKPKPSGMAQEMSGKFSKANVVEEKSLSAVKASNTLSNLVKLSSVGQNLPPEDVAKKVEQVLEQIGAKGVEKMVQAAAALRSSNSLDDDAAIDFLAGLSDVPAEDLEYLKELFLLSGSSRTDSDKQPKLICKLSPGADTDSDTTKALKNVGKLGSGKGDDSKDKGQQRSGQVSSTDTDRHVEATKAISAMLRQQQQQGAQKGLSAQEADLQAQKLVDELGEEGAKQLIQAQMQAKAKESNRARLRRNISTDVHDNEPTKTVVDDGPVNFLASLNSDIAPSPFEGMDFMIDDHERPVDDGNISLPKLVMKLPKGGVKKPVKEKTLRKRNVGKLDKNAGKMLKEKDRPRRRQRESKKEAVAALLRASNQNMSAEEARRQAEAMVESMGDAGNDFDNEADDNLDPGGFGKATISDTALSQLEQQMSGSSAAEVAAAAMALGATSEQVMKLAESRGASADEMRAITAAVDMSKANAAQEDVSVSAIVSAAMKQGVSLDQAVQVAKEQGCSAEEVALYAAAMLQQSSPGTRREMSSSEVESLQSQMSDASPIEVAAAALARGASPSQAVQVAIDQGASDEEVQLILQTTTEASSVPKGSLQANQVRRDAALRIISSELPEGLESGQFQVSGAASTSQVVTAALAQGASAEQVAQLAQAYGASEEHIELIQAAIKGQSMSKAVSHNELCQMKRQMPDASALELASAALAKGASVAQVAEMALAEGASEEEVKLIESMAKMTHAGNGASLLSRGQMHDQAASLLQRASASLVQGAKTEDILKAAKSQGASADELKLIEAVAKTSSGKGNKTVSEKALRQLAQEMSQSSPVDIAAAALAQGATPQQAAKIASQQGASAQELEMIAAVAAGMEPLGLTDHAVQELKSQMPPNASAIEIAAAALAQGASLSQLANISNGPGVSKAELELIEVITNASAASTKGMTEKALQNLKGRIKNASASEIVKAALAGGATLSQVAQLAQDCGGVSGQELHLLQEAATKERSFANASALRNGHKAEGIELRTLAQIQKHISDLPGLRDHAFSTKSINIPLAVMKGSSTPTELALAAKAQGASPAQILSLAKAQGASKAELDVIGGMIGAASTGVSDSVLATLSKDLAGAPAVELAAKAMAKGASVKQVVVLAQAQGATPDELNLILAAAVSNEATSDNELLDLLNAEDRRELQQSSLLKSKLLAAVPGLGSSLKAHGISTSDSALLQAAVANAPPLERSDRELSPSALQMLKRDCKGASAVEIVAAALLKGASTEQAIQLAKEKGAKAEELEAVKAAAKMAEVQRASNSSSTKVNCLKEKDSADVLAVAASALSSGGSIESVILLAKAQGATEEEQAAIVKMSAHLMAEFGDKGGDENKTSPMRKISRPRGASAEELAQLNAALLADTAARLKPLPKAAQAGESESGAAKSFSMSSSADDTGQDAVRADRRISRSRKHSASSEKSHSLDMQHISEGARATTAMQSRANRLKNKMDASKFGDRHTSIPEQSPEPTELHLQEERHEAAPQIQISFDRHTSIPEQSPEPAELHLQEERHEAASAVQIFHGDMSINGDPAEDLAFRKTSAARLAIDAAKDLLRSRGGLHSGQNHGEEEVLPKSTNAAEFRARRSSRRQQYFNVVAKAESEAALSSVRLSRRTQPRLSEPEEDFLKHEMRFKKYSEGSKVDLTGIRYVVSEPIKRDDTQDSQSSTSAREILKYSSKMSTATSPNRRRGLSSPQPSRFFTPSHTPSLSSNEVDELVSVFKQEDRFRTMEDMHTVLETTTLAFDEALKQLEGKHEKKISQDNKQKLEALLKQKFDDIAALRRILQEKVRETEAASKAAAEARRQQRREQAQKDLEQSTAERTEEGPYLKLLRDGFTSTTTQRLRRNDIPEKDLKQYSKGGKNAWRTSTLPFRVWPTSSWSTLSPYNTNNTSILRPSVRRRFLLRKQLEEEREIERVIKRQDEESSKSGRLRGSTETDITGVSYATDRTSRDYVRETRSAERKVSRISGLKYAKVPLMVYSSGGFTRCFRLSRFYETPQMPAVGLRYRWYQY